jgi:uncharacterized protein
MSVKIGVIADTHLPQPSKDLCCLMTGAFKDVSMILHAGDLTRLKVLEAFRGIQTIAVCGNMDRSEVVEKLEKKTIIDIDGYRIGLIHGWGSPKHIEERVIEQFDHSVHAIIFGHTHKPVNHIVQGILMFNPGAFSGSFLLKRKRSVGILTIDDGISGTIIPV